MSKKCCEDKHVDFLLICEGEKKHCVLIKDFNTFIYDFTLYCGRKGHKWSSFCGTLGKKIAKSVASGFQNYNSAAAASSR